MGRPLKNKEEIVVVPVVNKEETEHTSIARVETSALQEISKAEIDVSIATAKKYPRSIAKFRQTAISMATLDPQVAASCFYKVRRGDGFIEGPSVRLAEIAASAWGNIRIAARIIEEGEKYVTAQGIAHDLERNFSGSSEVRRRIVDKMGRRYSDDMVLMTMAASCAIARRNAILEVVPRAYITNILDKAKKVAVGSAKTLVERRNEMIEAFSKMGIDKDKILIFTEKKSIEDIDLTDIENLIGVFTAIKDGTTTIDEQFPHKKAGIAMPQAKKDREVGEEG